MDEPDFAYILNIPQIDAQHKEWISIFDDLRAYVESNHYQKINDGIKVFLERIYAYVEFHFDYEEKILYEMNYPGYVEHKKEHDNLIRAIHGYLECFFSGKIVSVDNILSIVEIWIEDHILLMDKDYAQYITEKNIEVEAVIIKLGL